MKKIDLAKEQLKYVGETIDLDRLKEYQDKCSSKSGNDSDDKKQEKKKYRKITASPFKTK